jgi:hypothetical protein
MVRRRYGRTALVCSTQSFGRPLTNTDLDGGGGLEHILAQGGVLPGEGATQAQRRVSLSSSPIRPILILTRYGVSVIGFHKTCCPGGQRTDPHQAPSKAPGISGGKGERPDVHPSSRSAGGSPCCSGPPRSRCCDHEGPVSSAARSRPCFERGTVGGAERVTGCLDTPPCQRPGREKGW